MGEKTAAGLEKGKKREDAAEIEECRHPALIANNNVGRQKQKR